MNMIFRVFERLIHPFEHREIEFKSKSPLRVLLEFVKSARAVFLGYFIAGLASALVDAGILVWFGVLVDAAVSLANDQDPGVSSSRLLVLSGLLIILRPLTTFFLVVFSEQGVQANFSPMIRWQFYRRLSRQSLRFFTREKAGNLASKTWQSGQSAAEVCNQFVAIIWTNAVFLVSALVMLVSLEPAYALILIGWATIFGFLVRWFVPQARDRSRAAAQRSNITNGDLVDEYANIQVIKSFLPVPNRHEYIQNSIHSFVKAAKSFLRVISISRIAVALVNSIGLAGVVLLTVWFWSTGAISVGQGAMAIGFGLRLDSHFGVLLGQLTAFFRSYGVFQASIETLSTPIEIGFPIDGEVLEDSPPSVSLTRVTFGYNAKEGVVDDLSLDIAPGEKVGIVGPSGSGKSTIASLLLRLYDPSDGSVQIGRRDVRTLDEDSLRATIGYVSQDNALLHRSIRDNLLIAKPNATDAELIEALKMALAWEFVSMTKDTKGNQGLDIMVGERGLQLSGGQRQRVSLARAFLKQPNLLILDEATSALDATLDAAINQQLQKQFSNKTVLTIAHRLSTITWVDRIVVIHDGRLAEMGPFQDLVRNEGGLFWKMWRDQETVTSTPSQGGFHRATVSVTP